MRELICEHKEGWKVRTLIESSVIVETINALRSKGFQTFIVKSISNVNPENYNWKKEGGKWLSAN